MKVQVEVDVQSDEEVQEAVIQRLSETFTARCGDDLREDVRAQLREAMQARIGLIIDDVFATPFHETNRYGEKTGEPIMIRDLIVRETKRYLEEPVDEHGRSGSNGYGAQKSRIQRLAEKHAGEVVKDIVDPQAKAVVAKIKAESQGKIAKIVTDAIHALATNKD